MMQPDVFLVDLAIDLTEVAFKAVKRGAPVSVKTVTKYFVKKKINKLNENFRKKIIVQEQC